jgi:hypothetical protein
MALYKVRNACDPLSLPNLISNPSQLWSRLKWFDEQTEQKCDGRIRILVDLPKIVFEIPQRLGIYPPVSPPLQFDSHLRVRVPKRWLSGSGHQADVKSPVLAKDCKPHRSHYMLQLMRPLELDPTFGRVGALKPPFEARSKVRASDEPTRRVLKVL